MTPPTLLNNRYRILQTLGSGGFGNTFLAEDTYMPSGRRCVIKQLKPVTHDPQAYKMVQERFQREAAVLEELGEGNNQIPRLYAYFSEADQFYLVQEWIQGDTLTKKLEKEGSLSENQVRQILVSLLPVLDYVHSRRMIHRDIKPDNIIIRQRDGLPVLIDFGAVKEAMKTVVNAPINSVQSMVIGTPGFMPSEQAAGRPTYASDLYSLGLTAIFLLTGKMPQELQTDPRTGEILWRQYAPNIHSSLASVIDRTVRLHPGDRFSTAKEMLDALSAESLSEINTVAIAPGGLPQTPNRPTQRSNIPPAPPTVMVGKKPAGQGNDTKPLIIGALIAGGVLLGTVAIGAILRRSPSSSPVASDIPPVPAPPSVELEQPSTEQPSFPTDSTPGWQPSEPTSEQPVVRRPLPLPPSSSGAVEITPSPVLPDPPSEPSAQVPATEPAESSPPESIQLPVLEPNNSNPNPPTGIPGFATGTQQSAVEYQLGEPTKVSKGAWPNTRAVLYEDFVPGQVSLGYLFDRSSSRLRQTEVAFDQSVGLETMKTTLSKLLHNNASAEVLQGLETVYQRKSNRYRFVSGRDSRLKGVIERNRSDRIYIGVWEADLH